MPPTRYAILGFGLHGIRRLVPAFAGAQQSTLNGIWRRDPVKAEANARDHKIPLVFQSAEALCDSPEIDAVFVTSPDSLHCEHTLLALAHGKHVLCEKPVAMNHHDVSRMIDAARDHNLCFGAAQNFRYNPSSERIRQWIGEGRIGAPRLAHAQFTFDATTSARQWIYDPALARGGPIGDIGSHCIDLLRFVLNDNVRQVAAVAAPDQHSGPLEASAALSLGFTRGCFAAVTVSFRGAYRTALEISGDTGQIIAEDGLSSERNIRLTLLRNGKTEIVEEISNAGSYSRMLDAFAAWTRHETLNETLTDTRNEIRNQTTYAAPGTDALETQRTLDAAYESCSTQRTITL